MQLLKIIVIGLGILIILGLALLGYGLVQKTKNPGWQLFSLDQEAKIASSSKDFPTFDLNLPEGCNITGAIPDGSKVFLIITGSPLCNQVIAVDIRQGRTLGAIKARP
jgi:hypothetical protein